MVCMRKFHDVLDETTSLTSGEIASDDDGAPGTTVFGDKMVPVVVPNRLTGKTIKYVPAADLDQEWNYDEFNNSMSMGSVKAYSKTLDDLDGVLGGRLFSHTDRRKFRMQGDKWVARKGNQDGGGVKQTAKLSDDGEETMDIQEKINRYLGEPEEVINEEIIDTADRKLISKAIMSGKTTNIKVKSLGIDATVRNDGEEVDIIYPNSEDFTMALIDIADALGYKFTTQKSGNKMHFVIYID